MAGYLSPGAYFYAEEQEYLQAYEDVLERYKGRAALPAAGPPHRTAPAAARPAGRGGCGHGRLRGWGGAPWGAAGPDRPRRRREGRPAAPGPYVVCVSVRLAGTDEAASAINKYTVSPAPVGETHSLVFKNLFFE